MCKAIEAAEYLTSESYNRDNPINNSKLQKLLYYAQGYSFLLRGKELFTDDIYAWDCGPAIRTVYSIYRALDDEPIRPFTNSRLESITDSGREVLNKVLERYLDTPINTLIERTKLEHPFLNNYERGKMNIIPREDIKKYFEGMKKIAC